MNLKDCLESLNVCFDNDNAGLAALKTLQTYELNGVPCTDRIPTKAEDWNEVLKMEGVG